MCSTRWQGTTATFGVATTSAHKCLSYSSDLKQYKLSLSVPVSPLASDHVDTSSIPSFYRKHLEHSDNQLAPTGGTPKFNCVDKRSLFKKRIAAVERAVSAEAIIESDEESDICLSVSEHAVKQSLQHQEYHESNLKKNKGYGKFSNRDFMPSQKMEFKS